MQDGITTNCAVLLQTVWEGMGDGRGWGWEGMGVGGDGEWAAVGYYYFLGDHSVGMSEGIPSPPPPSFPPSLPLITMGPEPLSI